METLDADCEMIHKFPPTSRTKAKTDNYLVW